MLERYGHGGDWVTASKRFGIEPSEILDYSANINPLGPPPELKRVLTEEWDFLTRYPDPEVNELREVIADKYTIAKESIVVGNGAAELIDLVVRYFKPKRAAVVDPAFSEYEEALGKIEADMVRIPTFPDDEFKIPMDQLWGCCEAADLIFLGQPNNPTGQWMDRESLMGLVRNALDHQTVIVLDEAFIDFFDQEMDITMIREASELGHLVVIRSLTKFYAIPGLRLGYLVTRSDQASSIKKLQVPWSVNHLAQRAGVVALQDHEYEHRTRNLIHEERGWLMTQLEQLGLRPYNGAANFILVQMPANSIGVPLLQQRLGEKGILIRSCTTFRGLDDRFFRIAVRTRTENARLIEVLGRETSLL
jgi:threonine-phosphate decarboxylase